MRLGRLPRCAARRWPLALLLLLAVACRADVEGDWSGHIGDEAAAMTLEQHGSRIEGEVCVAERCSPVYEGDLDEGDLELFFDCDGCLSGRTLLSLSVGESHLEGEARAQSCDCMADAECACREPALFTRCPGPCR